MLACLLACSLPCKHACTCSNVPHIASMFLFAGLWEATHHCQAIQAQCSGASNLQQWRLVHHFTKYESKMCRPNVCWSPCMLHELLCTRASSVYNDHDESCHWLQVCLSLYQECMYRSPEYVKCQPASLNSLLQQHLSSALV